MSDPRKEWGDGFVRCFLCGALARNVWPPRLETHEIARGPAKEKSMSEPATWLRCCHRCHEDRLAAMPIPTQLALKRMNDPPHYDRIRVNVLRGRQPEAVGECEVLEEVARLTALAEASETGFPFPRWKV